MMDDGRGRALFNAIAAATATQPRRDGQLHLDCPLCGKEARRGQTHFSVYVHNGEAFGHCFVCGQSAGPHRLRQVYLGAATDYVPTPANRPTRPPTPPAPPRHWQRDPAGTLAQLTRLPLERRLALWQRYKPVTADMVEQHGLGYGVLPSSRCRHPRLVVPLFDDGVLVGLRGRAIACACGKWLSPAGNRATLYNAEALAPGCSVIIMENPLDALLWTYHTAARIVAVATLSVSYLLPRYTGGGVVWNQPEWIAQLRAVKPSGVVVMYDNHRPGNGNGRREWLAEHDTDIEPNGVKLVNGLRADGFDAKLYDWRDRPIGADPGWLLDHFVTKL